MATVAGARDAPAAAGAVRYERWRSQGDFRLFVQRVIAENGAKTVCELGAGANPALDADFVREHGLRYVLVDISPEELDKAEASYPKVVADVTAPDFRLDESFDVVLSRTLAEHVADPAAFHRNVRGILRDGGRAVHFFPTLYALPFVVNRLLPDWASEQILRRADPRRVREGKHAKFHAYYRWCVGPTARQLERLSALGYDVEQYVGFFGHDYYGVVRPAHAVARRFWDYLVRHPVPHVTSYAYVVLRRRAESG